MKFLVSIPKERTTADSEWTTRREPVVPCFPSQSSGAFLTVPGFKLAEKAEVAETGADADEMALAMVKEYPGLPRALHENYILAVWKAVFDVQPGTVFTVTVNQRQATLVEAGTRSTTILWNEQPLSPASELVPGKK